MSKKKLLINSLSLLANRLVQGVSTFVLTTFIARSLGADELGKYILAISYYYIFVTFFGLGLRTLFIRELSRDGVRTPVYLVSGTALQFLLSITAYLLLFVVVSLMPYDAETKTICILMGLSVIPFALSNITEAIFQAQERMHLITLSTVPIYLLRVGAMIWTVKNITAYPIEWVSVIMVASEAIILILQWLLILGSVKPQWRIEPKFMVTAFHGAKTFFAIDGAGILASKLDILFISLLGSPVFVGIYGAIRQLMQPVEIISSTLCSALFPRLSKAVTLGRREQRRTIEKFLELLFLILLPLIPTFLFQYGRDILVFVYKNPEFAQGDTALKITTISMILYPLSRLLYYVLLSNNLEKYNLIEVVITTMFGGLAGILLISKYQLIGAACMGVAMACCTCGVMSYGIQTHLFRIRLGRVLVRPVLIAGLISLVLFLLQQTKLDLWLNLAIATVVYGAIAAIILVNDMGGIGSLRRVVNRSSSS
jgi:O-antigen/teichoic acid export membrane protein